MPYNITKTINGYKLSLKTGKLLGIHKTIKSAKKQISAIEINKRKKP
jgi:hypothetical protein